MRSITTFNSDAGETSRASGDTRGYLCLRHSGYDGEHAIPIGRGRWDNEMKIDHLAIAVEDLESATEFYTSAFGFEIVHEGRVRDHYSRHMTAV